MGPGERQTAREWSRNMQTLEFHLFSMHVVHTGHPSGQATGWRTPSQQCAMETAIQLNATGHSEFQTPPLWWHLSRYNWIFVCITIEYIPLLRMTAQYLDLTLPLQCKTPHNLCSKCKFATRTNWFQVDIALELCVPWFVENSIQQTSIEGFLCTDDTNNLHWNTESTAVSIWLHESCNLLLSSIAKWIAQKPESVDCSTGMEYWNGILEWPKLLRVKGHVHL